ncbi:MAG: VWA domain-containing protein [bacterium]
MKQLATIGAVVVLLLAAAFYFGTQKKQTTTEPTPPEVGTVVNTDPSQPVTNGELAGTLTLKAAISNGKILSGSTSDMYASIDIQALKYDGGKRPPLNVAIVLDRSGSMAGDKFEQLQAAARRLVNVLNEEDRLAIVSYGSDVTVDFPSSLMNTSNRARLMGAINAMSVGGGTNLSGGFQQGYSEVSRWKREDTVNRVILMSDGHANIGMTLPGDLTNLTSKALENGISVSTVGFGLDYNEDLMTQMANTGAGNYYFVDEANAVAAVFEKELQGPASTVARNTAVVITLAPGVSAEQVFGFPARRNGDQLLISLAEFRSDETKSILAKLKVAAPATGKAPIVDVSLAYEDVINNKPDQRSLALSAVTTSDEVAARTASNVDVIARVQQVEVAQTMQDAMNLYSEGKAAEATRRIEETQQVMKERRAKFNFGHGAKYDRVDSELDTLKGAVQAAPASSESGRKMVKAKKARSNAIMLDTSLF